jgi:hypothetical protein
VAKRLGPYRLLRVLGQGSFGVVYEALREGSQTPVALKVLLGVEHLDQEDLQRFWLEGQIACRLQEEGVVGALDMGNADGQVYLAMEFVPGETLADRLVRGPMELPEALALVRCLSRTMARVHRAGVLHRDLKPANVILDSRTGRPRITDFGLARDPSLLRSLTKSGDLLGTPAYMAPEQVRGSRDLDHRVDVYALGAILYECVTGRRVHQGGNLWEIFDQITTEPVAPPSSLRSELPPALDAVCARALAKDAGERTMNCDALSEDLSALLAGEGPAPDRPRSTRLRWLALMALVAVGSAGAALVFKEAGTPTAAPTQRPPALEPSASQPPPPSDVLEAARRARALLSTSEHTVEHTAEVQDLALTWAPAARAHPAAALDALGSEDLEALAKLLEQLGSEAHAKDRERIAELRARRWLAAAKAVPTLLALENALQSAKHVARQAGLEEWVERVNEAHPLLLVQRGHYAAARKHLTPRVEGLKRDHPWRLLLCDTLPGSRLGELKAAGLYAQLAKTAAGTPTGLVAQAMRRLALADPRQELSAAEREKHRAQAERAAQSALARDPQLASARWALAFALTLRRAREAVELWAQARRLAPRDSRVAWLEARALRQRRFESKAHARERSSAPPDLAKDARDQRRPPPAPEARARDRYLELTQGASSYARADYLRSRGWERVVSHDPGARADLQEVIQTRPFDARAQFGLALLAIRLGEQDAGDRLMLAAALAPEPHPTGGPGLWEFTQDLSPLEAEEVLDALGRPTRFAAQIGALPEAHRRPLAWTVQLAVSAGQSHAKVAEALKAAAALEPDHPLSALLRLRIAVGRGLFPESELALRACRATGAPEGATTLLEADLSARRGRIRDAAKLYAKVAQGEGYEAEFAQAELHLLRGELSEARALSASLAQQHPGAARVALILGTTLVHDKPTQALMLAARARALLGDLDARSIALQLRAHTACVLEEKSRLWMPKILAQAIPSLTPSAFARLAVVDSMLRFADRDPGGYREFAQQALARLILREPEYPLARVYAGRMLLETKASPQEVLAAWKQFRDGDPFTRIPPRDLTEFRRQHPASAAALASLTPSAR